MPGPQTKTLIAVAIVAMACRNDEPRISDSTTASTTVAHERVTDPRPDVDSGPAGVVRRYYTAIQSLRYSDAYALWSDSGRASGKTAKEFAAGFSETARVSVTVGDSVRIEGAAGSQYATIPVVVDATLRNGERQKFVGTYTVRRAMVDGASPEQRQWRIYSSQLQQR
jgi:hypothetical protein